MTKQELEVYYQNNQDKIEEGFEEYIEECVANGEKRAKVDTDKRFWEYVANQAG